MINNKNIFDWVNSVISLPAGSLIRADQNGPRPTGPYATFKIIGSSPSDFSLLEKTDTGTDDDVTESHRNRHKVIVDVNVYDDSGIDFLGKLNQSRYLLTSRLVLQAVDCVLIGSGDIRDLSLLGDTEYRPRYQSEFTFYSWNIITEVNQKVLTVELKGKWNEEDVVIDL